MDGPLESRYFKWLCAKVMQVIHPTPSLTYRELLHCLHMTEFVWLLIGDDNRAEDGLELREEFIDESNIPDNPEWREAVGCSVLEMLIAFSRRAEFDTDIPAKDWFWVFIDNLDINFVDAEINPIDVEDSLDTFIWRTYEPNGYGGLFPLDHPKRDQRTVEIWYQFCEYVIEKQLVP